MITLPDSMPFSDAQHTDCLWDIPCRLGLSYGFAGGALLVLGAAGGVGLTAVELGKLMGARVIAVARGADKCAIATQRAQIM